MKTRLKECRRMRSVCLQQAQTASTELEKNALLDVAEQYSRAIDAVAFVESARRSRRVINGVTKGDLQVQSQWFSGEIRTRVEAIKSLLWLAAIVVTVCYIALYVPW